MRKKPVTVTWELLDDDSGPKSIVVDVDAPLRPFGADTTPPRGTLSPGAKANANFVEDDTQNDLLLPVSEEGEPTKEDLT